MTLGITASYFTHAQSPAYQVNVSGLQDPVGEFTYTVTRVSTSPFGTGPVRNMDTITIVGQTDFQYDYEFSMTESFYYKVDVVNAGGSNVGTASTSLIDGQDAADDLRSIYGNWGTVLIRSTTQPALNQLVQINAFSTWSKAGRVLANMPVLDRRNPVVVTDTGGTRTGSFTILQTPPPNVPSYSNTNQTLEDLLDFGDTLMFQCLIYSPMYKDMFFKVSDISVANVNTVVDPTWTSQQAADEGHVMAYTVSFIETDRPATRTQQYSVTTWADVKNGYGTWQAVTDQNDRWLDLLNIQQ